MQIAVEEVERLLARKREINARDIAEIVWTRDGKAVEIPPRVIERFRYAGLSNLDFVDLYFHGNLGHEDGCDCHLCHPDEERSGSSDRQDTPAARHETA